MAAGSRGAPRAAGQSVSNADRRARLTDEQEALSGNLLAFAETVSQSDPWLAQMLRNRAAWWRDRAEADEELRTRIREAAPDLRTPDGRIRSFGPETMRTGIDDEQRDAMTPDERMRWLDT